MNTGGTDAGGPASTCSFEGQRYEPGETYQDDCNTCGCQEDGSAICTEIDCATCEVAGIEYLEGETFAAADGCNECECTNTGVSCTSGPCPAGCQLSGTSYEIGESIPDDDCNPRVCTTEGWQESTAACLECETEDDCDASAPFCNERCGAVGQCGTMDNNSAFGECGELRDCLPVGCTGEVACREISCSFSGPVCGCDGVSYESDCDAQGTGIAHEGLCEVPFPDGWNELGCQCNVEGNTAMLSLPCYLLLSPFVSELEQANQPEDCSSDEIIRRSEGCGQIWISTYWDDSSYGDGFNSETGELIASWDSNDEPWIDGSQPGECGVFKNYGGELRNCPDATSCSLCRDDPDPCPEAVCDPDAGTCP